jgi:hypothetical protein
MVSDLEAKEIVNCGKSCGVVSGYSQLRTPLSVFGIVCDFILQPPHRLYARRDGRMNEHRNGKIALGKLARWFEAEIEIKQTAANT